MSPVRDPGHGAERGYAGLPPDAAELLDKLRAVVPAGSWLSCDGDTQALVMDVPGFPAAIVVENGLVGYAETVEGLGTPDDAIRDASRRDRPLSAVLATARAPVPSEDPGVDAFLRLVAATAPARVTLAMAELGVHGSPVEAWLSDPVHGEGRLAACLAHAWLARRMAAAISAAPDGTLSIDGLAPAQAGPRFVSAWAGTSPEAAAWICASLGDGVARRVAARAVTESGRIADFPGCAELAGLATIPPGLRPGSGTVPGGARHLAAATLVSTDLRLLASLTGRDVRSVAGRVGDWASYAGRCADRALGPARVRGVAGHFSPRYRQARESIREMLGDLAQSVIQPAMLAEGWTVSGRSETPPGGGAAPCPDGAYPSYAGATRLALRGRTLPALAETSRAWHRRNAAITGLVALLRGPENPEGPRAFPDIGLDGDAYVTCVSTFEDLVAEGLPGEARDGTAGLDHCVASYAERVSSGLTAIASVRRRLPGGSFERLSTAEIDFFGVDAPRIVQHRGIRNAPVHAATSEALARALAPHARTARAALKGWKRSPGRCVRELPTLIHEEGAWERMRDLWAFALPRGLRKASPAEILAAAGLAVEGTTDPSLPPVAP